MVAYNFQRRFESLLSDGLKKQTIRPPRARPTVVGDSLQIYVGLRTKGCRKIINPDPICIYAGQIRIDRHLGFRPQSLPFHYGYLRVTDRAANAIARADGFDDFRQLKEFIDKIYGLPFYGCLIRW
jgi:hypothetical protein